MRIHQLLSGPDIAVTNEENRFMERYEKQVKLTSLDDRDQWVAQGLVRKGIYQISEDNVTLVKNVK